MGGNHLAWRTLCQVRHGKTSNSDLLTHRMRQIGNTHRDWIGGSQGLGWENGDAGGGSKRSTSWGLSCDRKGHTRWLAHGDCRCTTAACESHTQSGCQPQMRSVLPLPPAPVLCPLPGHIAAWHSHHTLQGFASRLNLECVKGRNRTFHLSVIPWPSLSLAVVGT